MCIRDSPEDELDGGRLASDAHHAIATNGDAVRGELRERLRVGLRRVLQEERRRAAPLADEQRLVPGERARREHAERAAVELVAVAVRTVKDGPAPALAQTF